jgi:hypothetical protein
MKSAAPITQEVYTSTLPHGQLLTADYDRILQDARDRVRAVLRFLEIDIRPFCRRTLLACYSSVIDTLEHLLSFPLQWGAHLLHFRSARRPCSLCILRSAKFGHPNQGQMSGQGSPHK